ncbi:MAG: galactokinase [Clostridia bacterium]|nr:galactokinase [Clostridia bacterium]
MKPAELIARLRAGALKCHTRLYGEDIEFQTERYVKAVETFANLYGADRDVFVFSVPGRSEVSGNHTDHNHGRVLAAAIDRDIIAVASPSKENVVRVRSEGYNEDRIDLSICTEPEKHKPFKASALVAGMCGGFLKNGYKVGGFDAYTTSRVLKGSGISSSAAFEVMIGNILNYLYNDGSVPNVEIAKIAQYAENAYFGKPCGLMDQMACAVGGFVYIDFADPKNPVIEPINFSPDDAGYVLCIVNTGGNHANLNDDYASVPAEMKAVAAALGREVLRGTTEDEILAVAPTLRKTVGDRAILRALHFVRENDRVTAVAAALKAGDVPAFLTGVLSSGHSSFEYLQNVYTTINVREQGLSLALAVTAGILDGKSCAWRVHGGGFAGTVQVFLPATEADAYRAKMDAVFGEGAAMLLRIRPDGAIRVDL